MLQTGFNFLRIEGSRGAVTDNGAYHGNFNTINAKQNGLLPYEKDTMIFINRSKYTIDAAVDLYYMSAGGMSPIDRNFRTYLTITPINMARCDDSTVIIMGKTDEGNYRSGRFNVKTRMLSWSKDEQANYTIDMASSDQKHVYTTGRNNNSLVIRRINSKDGATDWEQLITPASQTQYYVPIDQKFNSFKNQYTVVGYIVDSVNASYQQSAFYITVDSVGREVNKWIGSGDYLDINSLNTVEITQYGQTLIGGTISNKDYINSRSGIFIVADTAAGYPPSILNISISPAAPVCEGDTITLTANSPGCINCTYLWEANYDSAGATLKVTASGSYKVKAYNNIGSLLNTQTVVIKETPDKPTIIKEGNIFISSSTSGNQWFLNQAPISGATSKQIKVDSSGLYTVQVNEDGCLSKMSDTVRYLASVIIDTIPSVVLDTALSTYPNPAIDKYNIVNSAALHLNITFYNSEGSLEYNVRSAEKKIVIDIGSFGRGIYYVMIVDEKTGKKTIKRIMKL